jgi:parallel beta-helix repeat protein
MRRMMAIIMVTSLVVMVFTALPANIAAKAPVVISDIEPLEYINTYEPENCAVIGTVYIKADGTIDPVSAPIDKDGEIYTLTDNIYDSIVIQRSGITLDGDGYTVEGTGGGIGVYGTSLSDVTVKNLYVQTFNIGIRFDYTSYSTIMMNMITGINRAGVAIWYDTSSDNVISQNEISYCGWGIVLIYGANNNLICENEISYCSGDGIQCTRETYENTVCDNYLEGNDHGGINIHYSASNTLTDNEMVDCGVVMWGTDISNWVTHSIDTSNTVNGNPVYYWIGITDEKVPKGAGEVILADCHRVSVCGQDIQDSSHGIVLGFSTDCMISDNIVGGCSYGIHAHSGSYDNVICDNEVGESVWGIYSSGNLNNEIKDNHVYGCEVGIRVWGAYSIEVNDNHVMGCSYASIFEVYSGYCMIKNNQATNSQYGIRLYGSSFSTVMDNDISNNLYGIAMTHDSDSNTLKCNMVEDNSDEGLIIYYGCNDNLICENTISNSIWGVDIYDSNNNQIYHNNIINNKYQLWFGAASNIWDNGKGEGNYWSDYEGMDLDHDGVGDTDLPHQGVDWYPLMKPYKSK